MAWMLLLPAAACEGRFAMGCHRFVAKASRGLTTALVMV